MSKLTSAVMATLSVLSAAFGCSGSPTTAGAATGGRSLGAMGGNTSAASGGATSTPTTNASVYGAAVSGQYQYGPVDFAESEWHNACAPAGGYPVELQASTGLGGEYLAGLSNEYANAGGTCDACILINTATGRSIVARVVTYGDENAPGDIDVSPSVFSALNTGEYPRSMTWQFATCPDTGTLQYEFQTASSIWWTSFWVRNPRVPLTTVEVESANHASFFALRRETDGTLNDDGGFGAGSFTLRLTAMDGQSITDTFPSFTAGQIITSTQQFQ